MRHLRPHALGDRSDDGLRAGYWAFESPEEQPGEDVETAGAWIQLLELRPPSSHADLTFEP